MYPSVRLASYVNCSGLTWMWFLLMASLSMASLPLISGRGMYTRFSNLLRTAGSKAQGKLVAPRTNTSWQSLPTPCICIKNSVFTLLETSFSSEDRYPAMESISSMKIMLGRSALAIWKSAFNVFSDCPTYFDIKSEAEMLKNVPPFCSVAQAFAK